MKNLIIITGLIVLAYIPVFSQTTPDKMIVDLYRRAFEHIDSVNQTQFKYAVRRYNSERYYIYSGRQGDFIQCYRMDIPKTEPVPQSPLMQIPVDSISDLIRIDQNSHTDLCQTAEPPYPFKGIRKTQFDTLWEKWNIELFKINAYKNIYRIFSADTIYNKLIELKLDNPEILFASDPKEVLFGIDTSSAYKCDHIYDSLHVQNFIQYKSNLFVFALYAFIIQANGEIVFPRIYYQEANPNFDLDAELNNLKNIMRIASTDVKKDYVVLYFKYGYTLGTPNFYFHGEKY